ADGTIQEVKGDMAGIPQIQTLNPYQRTEAETIGWNAGISTEVCQASGGPTSNMDVTNIHNGDWIALGNVAFGDAGAKSFKANVASTVGGKIEIRLDSDTGKLVGTLDVPSTGGAQTWKTIETNISGATGVHKLYLMFTGTGTGNLFNFDYWQFAADQTPTEPKTAFTQIEAEDFNDQSGVETETCGEGGQNVGYIENGDYAVYSNINFGSGASSFEARAASATSGGAVEIRLDSIDGTLVGYCPIEATGDWQTYATSKCNIDGLSGTHNLYLKFTGGSGYLFNLNWFKFNPKQANLTGDVDGNGKVNSADVAILKRIILGTYTGDTSNADVNRDGKINSTDYSIVKRIVLGTYTTS
ncbi:MAG TPA: carbohydrate-binding protein, partial [Clostridia bacterium]